MNSAPAFLANAGARPVNGTTLIFDVPATDSEKSATRSSVVNISLFGGTSYTATINSSNTDPVAAIQELTDGNGVDVAIEAVGNPAVYEQAFFARDLAGTVVLVGVPNPEMKIELPMLEVFGRGGALKSSWYGDCLPTRDFPLFIDLYLQGRLDLDGFVSETIGLGDVEEAFHKMERGEVLRSVVVM